MRRYGRALCAGMSFLLGVAASTRSGGDDLDAMRARGTLRVLTHFDRVRPEFSGPDEASPGIDCEILNGFANLQKLKVERIEVTGGSDVRIAALLAGRGDVVAGRFVATPERARRIGLTVEIFPGQFVILTRRPTPIVTTAAGLRGYKVGTVGTSQVLVNAAKMAQVRPDQLDDSFKEPTDMVEGLRTGRVAAIITGLDTALPARREDPAIQIGGVVGAPSSFAFGVRKEDAGLLKALNDYIANLRRSPTWNRLVLKYFGDGALEILRTARGEGPS